MKVQNQPGNPTSAAHTRSAGKADKAGTPEASRKAGDAVIAGSAKTDISGKAKEMNLAKKVATEAPDVREDKVAHIKSLIAQGKYEVDPDAIAEKMVEEHRDL